MHPSAIATLYHNKHTVNLISLLLGEKSILLCIYHMTKLLTETSHKAAHPESLKGSSKPKM